MKIFTIGFTKKSARDFFGKLKSPGIKRLVDVRLNNVSQLAGFAKRDDLRFFLEAICNIEYVHVPLLAPTQEMLDTYRKAKRGWDNYEKQFLGLMAQRRIETEVSRDVIDGGCLLCSEETPERCHRRLVAEYLSKKWGDIARKVSKSHLRFTPWHFRFAGFPGVLRQPSAARKALQILKSGVLKRLPSVDQGHSPASMMRAFRPRLARTLLA